jgi:hypothetical protein
MPKIDIAALPLRTGTGYPEPLRDMVKGRERKASAMPAASPSSASTTPA